MAQFISVIDLTTKKDEGNCRKVSLAFGFTTEKEPAKKLCLLGVLPHNTEITFDKENAQKMIDFCQGIIENK